MNAAIGNQVLKGDTSGLATNRIEAGEDNGLRRVVDDEVDAGHLLERADVAAFATDDTALEVVRGNVNGRDGDLSGVIGSATLDGEGDDLLSGLMAFSFDLLLGLANDRGGLMGHFAANLVEKLGVCVLAGKLRNALELVGLTSIELLKLTRALVDLTLLAGKLVLALIKGLIAAIKGLLALHHTVLKGADLLLALGLLSLGGLPQPRRPACSG